jgi:RNA 2',3'-cyclic 3'-phosphodiesterase
MSVRAFIAISLRPELKQALVKIQQGLQSSSGVEAVRWTALEQLHLTLKFLGNISEERLPELRAALDQACRGMRSFKLCAAKLGCFPTMQRPSVIWVGLDGELNILRELQQRIEEATADFGSHSEERAFHPHLTIGRVKGRDRNARRLSDAIRASAEIKLGEWTISEVNLIQSKLSPQGSIYTRLHSARLSAA